MRIGNLEIDSRTAGLAPMAGVADMAFRELCCEYGATYVVSEMVSSKGLTMCDRKSKKLLVLSEKERPAAAQNAFPFLRTLSTSTWAVPHRRLPETAAEAPC